MARTRKPQVIRVEAHRIAYQALPKAGCSSVKQALARIDPDVTLPAEDAHTDFTWHRIYPTVRFRPMRWKPFEAEEWFGFCVVRDPTKRLLSCYTDRVLKRNELRNSPKVRNNPDLPEMPDPDFFFLNLAAYRKASSTIKHHSCCATLFIGPNLSRYDRVYRTSELNRLAQDLSARAGQAVEMPRANRSAMSLSLEALKPEARDAIRPFLESQYALLSDYYDNPLA